MFDLKTILKRFPVTALVWLAGGIACALILGLVGNNASSLAGTTFVMLVTYIPYIIMAICTAVAVVLCEQSFAALLLSLIFSLAMGISALIIPSNWMADPAFVSALMINSPENYQVMPLTARPMTVLIHVMVSLLIPIVVGMVCSWAHGKFFSAPAPKKISEMSKSEKKAARQAKYKH